MYCIIGFSLVTAINSLRRYWKNSFIKNLKLTISIKYMSGAKKSEIYKHFKTQPLRTNDSFSTTINAGYFQFCAKKIVDFLLKRLLKSNSHIVYLYISLILNCLSMNEFLIICSQFCLIICGKSA